MTWADGQTTRETKTHIVLDDVAPKSQSLGGVTDGLLLCRQKIIISQIWIKGWGPEALVNLKRFQFHADEIDMVMGWMLPTKFCLHRTVEPCPMMLLLLGCLPVWLQTPRAMSGVNRLFHGYL